MRLVHIYGLIAAVAAFAGYGTAQEPKPAWCQLLPRAEYKTLKRVRSADPWFEVYEVQPRVLAIYEPHQSEEVISYLIVGNQRALLFDTGLGIGDMAKTVHALTKLPVIVVNSHSHNDHVGDNWQFGDVRDFDSDFTRANARGSSADAQQELGPGQLCAPLPAGFDTRTYATRPWRVSTWLHDGDVIDLGGRWLEVLATPGHTPDSIALFDRAAGLAFTGDTLYAGEIYLYRPETDLAAYAHSLQRLIGLGANLRVILPAHNVPMATPAFAAAVRAAFERVRANQVAGTRRGSVTVYEFSGFSFRLAH